MRYVALAVGLLPELVYVLADYISSVSGSFRVEIEVLLIAAFQHLFEEASSTMRHIRRLSGTLRPLLC